MHRSARLIIALVAAQCGACSAVTSFEDDRFESVLGGDGDIDVDVDSDSDADVDVDVDVDADADSDSDSDADSDDGFVEGTCCGGDGDECRGPIRSCLSWGAKSNPYFCSRLCDPAEDDCEPPMYCIVWDGPDDGRCTFPSEPYDCYPPPDR